MNNERELAAMNPDTQEVRIVLDKGAQSQEVTALVLGCETSELVWGTSNGRDFLPE